jgi:biopolymer transport protein ExbB/TolQ
MSKKALRNPVWNRNREDGVYFGMNYRVVLAQHAAARSAAKVHREMGRGLCGLATVAATAPFVGMIGTVLGIINSFPGVTGERSAIMAAIAQRLSDSMMPTALGVALSVAALCGYRYFSAQIADFNSEIRNAILDLSNHLLVSRRM